MANDRERDSERTTIITRDGKGRGSAGIILAIALILVLLALLFFGGVFSRDEERDLNVDVNAPDVNLIVPPPPVVTVPETQVPPDINVNVTTPPPEPPVDNLNNNQNAVTNTG